MYELYWMKNIFQKLLVSDIIFWSNQMAVFFKNRTHVLVNHQCYLLGKSQKIISKSKQVKVS